MKQTKFFIIKCGFKKNNMVIFPVILDRSIGKKSFIVKPKGGAGIMVVQKLFDSVQEAKEFIKSKSNV